MLYNRDKVRRPIPEEKAISKAAEMIRVTISTLSSSSFRCSCIEDELHQHFQQCAVSKDQVWCSEHLSKDLGQAAPKEPCVAG